MYTIVEQVDKIFPRMNFTNHDGNLYKPETPPAALNWTKEYLDKQSVGVSQFFDKTTQNNLDIKIRDSLLGDLIKISGRERAPGIGIK